MASGGMTRQLLLGAGRASLGMWTRKVPAADPSLRPQARAAFDELSGRVPWPSQPVLRLHLVFFVLPGAALYTALRDHGQTTREATQAVTATLTALAAPHRRRGQRLMRSEPGRRLFMRVASASLRAFPAPGWQATWIERSPRRVAFDMTRCFDLDMLRQLDTDAIAPAYCAVDDILYTDLCPQLRFSRTGTLATGATRCDFRFDYHPTAAARR